MANSVGLHNSEDSKLTNCPYFMEKNLMVSATVGTDAGILNRAHQSIRLDPPDYHTCNNTSDNSLAANWQIVPVTVPQQIVRKSNQEDLFVGNSANLHLTDDTNSKPLYKAVTNGENMPLEKQEDVLGDVYSQPTDEKIKSKELDPKNKELQNKLTDSKTSSEPSVQRIFSDVRNMNNKGAAENPETDKLKDTKVTKNVRIVLRQHCMPNGDVCKILIRPGKYKTEAIIDKKRKQKHKRRRSSCLSPRLNRNVLHPGREHGDFGGTKVYDTIQEVSDTFSTGAVNNFIDYTVGNHHDTTEYNSKTEDNYLMGIDSGAAINPKSSENMALCKSIGADSHSDSETKCHVSLVTVKKPETRTQVLSQEVNGNINPNDEDKINRFIYQNDNNYTDSAVIKTGFRYPTEAKRSPFLYGDNKSGMQANHEAQISAQQTLSDTRQHQGANITFDNDSTCPPLHTSDREKVKKMASVSCVKELKGNATKNKERKETKITPKEEKQKNKHNQENPSVQPLKRRRLEKSSAKRNRLPNPYNYRDSDSWVSDFTATEKPLAKQKVLKLSIKRGRRPRRDAIRASDLIRMHQKDSKNQPSIAQESVIGHQRNYKSKKNKQCKTKKLTDHLLTKKQLIVKVERLSTKTLEKWSQCVVKPIPKLVSPCKMSSCYQESSRKSYYDLINEENYNESDPVAKNTNQSFYHTYKFEPSIFQQKLKLFSEKLESSDKENQYFNTFPNAPRKTDCKPSTAPTEKYICNNTVEKGNDFKNNVHQYSSDLKCIHKSPVCDKSVNDSVKNKTVQGKDSKLQDASVAQIEPIYVEKQLTKDEEDVCTKKPSVFPSESAISLNETTAKVSLEPKACPKTTCLLVESRAINAADSCNVINYGKTDTTIVTYENSIYEMQANEQETPCIETVHLETEDHHSGNGNDKNKEVIDSDKKDIFGDKIFDTKGEAKNVLENDDESTDAYESCESDTDWCVTVDPQSTSAIKSDLNNLTKQKLIYGDDSVPSNLTNGKLKELNELAVCLRKTPMYDNKTTLETVKLDDKPESNLTVSTNTLGNEPTIHDEKSTKSMEAMIAIDTNSVLSCSETHLDNISVGSCNNIVNANCESLSELSETCEEKEQVNKQKNKITLGKRVLEVTDGEIDNICDFKKIHKDVRDECSDIIASLINRVECDLKSIKVDFDSQRIKQSCKTINQTLFDTNYNTLSKSQPENAFDITGTDGIQACLKVNENNVNSKKEMCVDSVDDEQSEKAQLDNIASSLVEEKNNKDTQFHMKDQTLALSLKRSPTNSFTTDCCENESSISDVTQENLTDEVTKDLELNSDKSPYIPYYTKEEKDPNQGQGVPVQIMEDIVEKVVEIFDTDMYQCKKEVVEDVPVTPGIETGECREWENQQLKADEVNVVTSVVEELCEQVTVLDMLKISQNDHFNANDGTENESNHDLSNVSENESESVKLTQVFVKKNDNLEGIDVHCTSSEEITNEEVPSMDSMGTKDKVEENHTSVEHDCEFEDATNSFSDTEDKDSTVSDNDDYATIDLALKVETGKERSVFDRELNGHEMDNTLHPSNEHENHETGYNNTTYILADVSEISEEIIPCSDMNESANADCPELLAMSDFQGEDDSEEVNSREEIYSNVEECVEHEDDGKVEECPEKQIDVSSDSAEVFLADDDDPLVCEVTVGDSVNPEDEILKNLTLQGSNNTKSTSEPELLIGKTNDENCTESYLEVDGETEVNSLEDVAQELSESSRENEIVKEPETPEVAIDMTEVASTVELETNSELPIENVFSNEEIAACDSEKDKSEPSATIKYGLKESEDIAEKAMVEGEMIEPTDIIDEDNGNEVDECAVAAANIPDPDDESQAVTQVASDDSTMKETFDVSNVGLNTGDAHDEASMAVYYLQHASLDDSTRQTETSSNADSCHETEEYCENEMDREILNNPGLDGMNVKIRESCSPLDVFSTDMASKAQNDVGVVEEVNEEKVAAGPSCGEHPTKWPHHDQSITDTMTLVRRHSADVNQRETCLPNTASVQSAPPSLHDDKAKEGASSRSPWLLPIPTSISQEPYTRERRISVCDGLEGHVIHIPETSVAKEHAQNGEKRQSGASQSDKRKCVPETPVHSLVQEVSQNDTGAMEPISSNTVLHSANSSGLNNFPPMVNSQHLPCSNRPSLPPASRYDPLHAHRFLKPNDHPSYSSYSQEDPNVRNAIRGRQPDYMKHPHQFGPSGSISGLSPINWQKQAHNHDMNQIKQPIIRSNEKAAGLNGRTEHSVRGNHTANSVRFDNTNVAMVNPMVNQSIGLKDPKALSQIPPNPILYEPISPADYDAKQRMKLAKHNSIEKTNERCTLQEENREAVATKIRKVYSKFKNSKQSDESDKSDRSSKDGDLDTSVILSEYHSKDPSNPPLNVDDIQHIVDSLDTEIKKREAELKTLYWRKSAMLYISQQLKEKKQQNNKTDKNSDKIKECNTVKAHQDSNCASFTNGSNKNYPPSVTGNRAADLNMNVRTSSQASPQTGMVLSKSNLLQTSANNNSSNQHPYHYSSVPYLGSSNYAASKNADIGSQEHPVNFSTKSGQRIQPTTVQGGPTAPHIQKAQQSEVNSVTMSSDPRVTSQSIVGQPELFSHVQNNHLSAQSHPMSQQFSPPNQILPNRSHEGADSGTILARYERYHKSHHSHVVLDDCYICRTRMQKGHISTSQRTKYDGTVTKGHAQGTFETPVSQKTPDQIIAAMPLAANEKIPAHQGFSANPLVPHWNAQTQLYGHPFWAYNPQRDGMPSVFHPPVGLFDRQPGYTDPMLHKNIPWQQYPK